MPRQPFRLVANKYRDGQVRIGRDAIAIQPEIFALVGQCLIAWPNVEAEMALALGQLLGAPNEAALAVFQTLRKSLSQRDAVAAAAVCQGEQDRELINAILNAHASVESERNGLAHGHLGAIMPMNDAILWMNTADYIAFKSLITLKGDRDYNEKKREQLYSSLSYYRRKDVEDILLSIDEIGWIWSELIKYLQAKRPEKRAELYSQLCDRPRIARELETLRQKNNSSTQPRPAKPNPSGTA
ncbi:MAG TPA: hypothetical protein VH575_19440 [Gemmataceae bacterium]|jgi:hypothetical protein